MTEVVQPEVQRGKRKTARIFEIVAIGLIGLAVWDFGATHEIFSLAFTVCLTYSAALRGLDARFAK